MAIRVELELVDGQFTTRMLHAGETVQQFNRNVAASYPHLRQMAAGGQLVFSSFEKADGVTKGHRHGNEKDAKRIAKALLGQEHKAGDESGDQSVEEERFGNGERLTQ